MTPAPPGPVLCVGAATWDVILKVPAIPDRPTKVLADDLAENAAGMANSAGITIVALGGAAASWARLGDDPSGHRWIDEISARGVDTRAVELIPGARSAHSTIIVDPSGDRLIYAYYDRRLRSQEPERGPAILEQAAAVMVDTRWPEASEIALRSARERGRPAVLDADVAPAEILARLVPLASHVVFSHEALGIHAGEGSTGTLLSRVAGETGAVVVVTQGEHGATFIEDGAITRVPAPSITAVDTLAAGDVFHGAFTLALLEGRGIESAVRFSNAAAALKCTRFGGIDGVPNRAEVDRLLASL